MANLGHRSALGKRFVQGLPTVPVSHFFWSARSWHIVEGSVQRYMSQTLILCAKHAYGTFLRLLKVTSKKVYWRLLHCSKAREIYGWPMWHSCLLA